MGTPYPSVNRFTVWEPTRARACERWQRRLVMLVVTGALSIGGCVAVVEPSHRESAAIIPRAAVVVDEGRNHLVCVARDPGTAYILDVDDRAVVLSVRLALDERFVFAPEDGKGLVNNKTIFSERLPGGHTYRLYFLPIGVASDPAGGGVDRLPPDRVASDRPAADRPADRDMDRRPVDPAPPPAPSADQPRSGLHIPATAQSVQRGTGRLTFTAPKDGEIYVRDNDNKTVVLGSTAVRGGDRFVLDPENNKGSLEGRNELGVTLSPTHEHEILYVPYADR